MAQTRMAVCLTDPTREDNPIIFANRAFFALTGYSPEEVIGKNCRFLQGPDTDPEAIERLRRGIADEDVCIVEILNYRKDGTPFWNALHLGPIYRDDGQLLYYFGSQWNVSDVYAARAEEQHARLLARELSHRVKNMFSVINAVVSLTARHERAPWIAAKVNDRISALGRAYEATLDDPRRRRVVLSDVIRMVLEPYTTADDPDRIRIEGPRVLLDPNTVSMLGLTLHELATSSVRQGALHDGAGRVSISWSLTGERPNTGLALNWRERGGPYGALAAAEFGSGIADMLIRGTNGELRTERTVDGLWATMRIPLVTQEEPPPGIQYTGGGDARDGDLAGRKILVLEDEALIALELQIALEEAGSAVELAMTAETALSMLEQHVFDAAVLDVNLGHNSTCAEVAERLREMGAPFVVHSGDLRRHGELVETLSAPVVAKPAPTGEIIRRLAELLRNARSNGG